MIKLFTDTSANLPVSIIREYGIEVVPFSYTVNGKEVPYSTEIGLTEGLKVNKIGKQRLNLHLGEVNYFFLFSRSGNGRILNFFLRFVVLGHIRGVHCRNY